VRIRILILAMFATGCFGSSPASPSTIDGALREMENETRHMTEVDSTAVYDQGHIRGLAALDSAMDEWTKPNIRARCSDEQAHRAAALAVELLDDRRAFRDDRPVDGGVFQVRQRAIIVLQVLSDQNLGKLVEEGGDQRPSVAALAEDANTVAAWKQWWRSAAPQKKDAWPAIKVSR
jgi:hypothetical protein